MLSTCRLQHCLPGAVNTIRARAGIPPTSNQAERDLRPAKTQQKISGRLRSETAARDRYAIRGYASTAAKNGTNALTRDT
jgi:hypothetical protein